MWGISEMANVDSVLMVGVHGSEPTREKALEKAGALLEEGGKCHSMIGRYRDFKKNEPKQRYLPKEMPG